MSVSSSPSSRLAAAESFTSQSSRTIFMDYLCPYCRMMARTIDSLQARYPASDSLSGTFLARRYIRWR